MQAAAGLDKGGQSKQISGGCTLRALKSSVHFCIVFCLYLKKEKHLFIGILIDLQEVVTVVYVHFTQLSPMVTSNIIIVQNQNQKINIDTTCVC